MVFEKLKISRFHRFSLLVIALLVSLFFVVSIVNRGHGEGGIITTFDHPGDKVPNIVHYVTFGVNREFTFLNYLSILSVYKVQKPRAIMFHCDNDPVGPYWKKTLKEIPTLTVFYHTRPFAINGQILAHVFHASDVKRLEILMRYGGIYIDYDVILINPLDDYLKYPCSMGKEIPPKFIAGIIIAEKDSKFIKLWYEHYLGGYDGGIWDYNSAIVPYRIAVNHPDLIHVEKWRFTTPDWSKKDELYRDNLNWRNLTLLHLMTHKTDHNLFARERIENMPGILGSVLRNTFFGSPEKFRSSQYITAGKHLTLAAGFVTPRPIRRMISTPGRREPAWLLNTRDPGHF